MHPSFSRSTGRTSQWSHSPPRRLIWHTFRTYKYKGGQWKEMGHCLHIVGPPTSVKFLKLFGKPLASPSLTLWKHSYPFWTPTMLKQAQYLLCCLGFWRQRIPYSQILPKSIYTVTCRSVQPEWVPSNKRLSNLLQLQYKGTPTKYPRESFTVEVLATFLHASSSLDHHDGYKWPISLWCKTLPSLAPHYMPFEQQLLVTSRAFLEIEALTNSLWSFIPK